MKLIWRISWSMVNTYSEVGRVTVHLSAGDRMSGVFLRVTGQEKKHFV